MTDAFRRIITADTNDTQERTDVTGTTVGTKRALDTDLAGVSKTTFGDDEALDVKIKGEATLFELTETTPGGVVFVGRTVEQPVPPASIPSQTSAIWQIERTVSSGTLEIRSFAGTGAFDQIWSDRESLFADPPFENTYSIQFTGVANSYGSVPHSADIDFANSDAFSLSCWFKTTSTAAFTLMMKTSAGSGNNGYTLEVDGSQRPILEFRGGGTGDRIRVRADSPTVTLNNGSWNHILVTKDATTDASGVSMYLNGTSQTLNLLNDTLSGTTTNTDPLEVGAAFAGGTPRFTGNIDEVSIWDVELTSSEVTEIYNSNNGVIDLSAGSTQISADLVSWWRMGDDISFPTVPDQQGSNDMTLQSAVTSGDRESEVPP